MDIATYLTVVTDPEGGGGGGDNAALFLSSTTFALGVIFVYLAPAADSHNFGFQVVPPLHCIHSTLYNLSPFGTHKGMSVGEAKLYGDRS